MDMVLELEIWSAPGRCLSAEAGNEVAAQALADLDLAPTVVLPLNSVASAVDSELLKQALAQGELSTTDFTSFCAAKGLKPNPQDQDSAARFLEQAYGRALAWVHIPAGPGSAALTGQIHRWARGHGFCLQDPLALYCLCNIEGQLPFPIPAAN